MPIRVNTESRCVRCGTSEASTFHDIDSTNAEIRHSAHAFVNPYQLSAEEDKAWRALKEEPNTKEDWMFLASMIAAFRRQFIARHTKPTVDPQER